VSLQPPPPPETPAPWGSEPRGIGGWLLALLVLQVFYLVVDGLGVAYAAWILAVGKRAAYMEPTRWMLAGQIILHGANFAVAVYATVLLAMQHARFLGIFKLQLVLFALVPLGELAVYWTLMGVFHGRAAIPEVPIGKVFVCLVISVALGVYLRHSDRVRNTFVR
jgi:Protein of unknown function (DUF2569)